ncbi:hypothetical protein B1778_06380 [Dehalococcoides mccartyi]|uniref:DUF7305 domain-containing protein n=1 Tax=Dehalococcoides TaxID=61434 RepID=UPI00098F40B0|nr:MULTISPECIES: hypothetical protein [Dehalococcoides]AQU06343.1 hypothetical protein B1777_06580 [Dehalococcoides mccartyi]AQU07785.1 hypothetical protein B1778_06380 [Dehalococcoides mccartyi]
MISMKKLIKGEKGASLAIALIFLAIGAIMLPPLLMLIDSGLKQGTTFEDRTGAIYSSDAGVEWVINILKTGGEGVTDAYGNIGLPNPQNPVRTYNLSDLNGSAVSVILTYHDVGSYYNVISTASLNGKSITTQATLKYQLSGGSVFDNAITSLDGDVKLTGSSSVISDPRNPPGAMVYSGGELILTGSSFIEGNVYADDGIDLGWSTPITGDAVTPADINRPGNISGTVTTGAAPQLPNVLTDAEIAAIVTDIQNETAFAAFSPGAITRSSDWSIGYWPVPDSVYYTAERIQRDLNISTSTPFTFKSSVYIGRNFNHNNSSTVTFEGPVVILGDLKVNGSGHIIFKNSVWVGGNVDLGGSVNVEFQGKVYVGGDCKWASGGTVPLGDTLYVAGDLKTTGSREVDLSGSIFVGGDLDLAGSSQIIGAETVVVLGDIDLTGSTKLTDVNEIPFILSPTGDFDMSGSSWVSAVVYAPQADVSLNGGVNLYGAVVSNSLTITGSSQIQYPTSLSIRTDLPGGGDSNATLDILTWDTQTVLGG